MITPPFCLIKPLVFALDPETAHNATIALLRMQGHWPSGGTIAPIAHQRPIEVMGLRFANRVGLAAGLDKNGEAVDGLARWGFGFIEVGTVTPRPQPGNPRPRLFRLEQSQGIINRMGFNNQGVDALLRHIANRRYTGILGINIGKNADTPLERAGDDYLLAFEKVYQAADYITVNLSSPNTPNLRKLQSGEALSTLLTALKQRQSELSQRWGKYTPLAIKIAPDLCAEDIVHISDTLRRLRIDALIATNTTLARDTVEQEAYAHEAGGLSGRPLFSRSTEVLRAFADQLKGEIPIIAAGGIDSGEAARTKLDAGAALLQIYSGLIYHGPALVGECIQASAGISS